MHGAATGWYSSEVMARALLMTGAWKGRFRWGMEPLHVNPAVLQSEDVAGAVVNLRAKKHWVALRYWENEFWLLDSQEEPKLLTPLEYRFYVKRHRDAYPILRFPEDDDAPMAAAADTCSTAVGPDDTLGTTFTDTVASVATAGISSGDGGSMVMSPSGTHRACSQHSLRAGNGAEQTPCQGKGDDAMMGDGCMEVDAKDVVDLSKH